MKKRLKNQHVKKAFLIFFLSTIISFSYAQSSDVLKKGNSVYIECSSANDHAKNLKEQLVSRMGEWNYWKMADNKKDADFVMEVETEASKGITLTSWGGTSVMAKVKLDSKTGETIWESDGFKSSPNGSNGFNSTNAVSKKILRAMKKKFN